VTTVAIVDYGAGNLGNARRAVAALAMPVVMVSDADALPRRQWSSRVSGPMVPPWSGWRRAALPTRCGGGR
jgi:hypothetical protein